MGATVLVTGVGQPLGQRVAEALRRHPSVDRVVTLDTRAPASRPADIEFVRADLRNPLLGRIMAQTEVDTVVHAGLMPASADPPEGSSSRHEHNVIGTMHLMAACQGRGSVRRVVFVSSGALYGSSPRDPALFTEDQAPSRPEYGTYAREVAEAEGYMVTLARRRPDMSVCRLRLGEPAGRRVRSGLTDYLRLPLVPVPLGFDARLQFLHEDDAVDAVTLAAVESDVQGAVNVAGDGVLPLSAALMRLRRPGIPVVTTSGRMLGAVVRRFGVTALDDEHIDYLLWGRAMDTRRMREDLGFTPRFTTDEAFADFASGVLGAAPVPAAVTDRARRSAAARGPLDGRRSR